MCEFFSCVATSEGQILFTDTNSHEDIIARSRLDDADLFLRRFVRLECPPPFHMVYVDEELTLPSWFTDRWIEIDRQVIELALFVRKAYEEFQEEIEPVRVPKSSINYLYDYSAEWKNFKSAEHEARIEYARAIKHLTGYVGK
jgi:hypothetical protein